MPQNQWTYTNPFESSDNNWTYANPFPETPDPYGFGSLQLNPAQLSPQDDQYTGGGIEFPNTSWEQFIKPAAPPTPETDGFLSYLTKPITTPLWEGGSRAGKFVGDLIRKAPDVPLTEVPTGYEDLNPLPNPNNLYASQAEFAGDFASGMTSPLNIGLGGLGGVRNAGLKLAARNINPGVNALGSSVANVANKGLKYGSVGVGLEGGYDLLNPESTLQERAFGLANLVGGAYGANVASKYDPKLIPEKIPSNRLGKEAPTPDIFESGPGINIEDLPGVRVINEAEIAIVKPNTETILNLKNSGFVPSGKRTPDGYPIMVMSEDTTVRPDPKLDPNFNQGEGDPELAGTVPMKNDGTPVGEWMTDADGNVFNVIDKNAENVTRQQLEKQAWDLENKGDREGANKIWQDLQLFNKPPEGYKEKIGTRTLLDAKQVKEVYGVEPAVAIQNGWVDLDNTYGTMYRPKLNDLATEDDLPLNFPNEEELDLYGEYARNKRKELAAMTDEELLDIRRNLEYFNDADKQKEEYKILKELVREELDLNRDYIDQTFKIDATSQSPETYPLTEEQYRQLKETGQVDNPDLMERINDYTVPAKNPIEQQIRDYIGITSNEELLAHIRDLQGMVEKGMELNENDLIELKVVAEELKKRGIPVITEFGDVLGEFDPDKDILASRNLDFKNPTLKDIEREISGRNIDPAKKDQIKFLAMNGKMRQAMAIIKDMPVKAVREIKTPDDFMGQSIPITKNTDLFSSKGQTESVTEQLWINPINERLSLEIENLIINEKNPEFIKDNLRQFEEYFEYAKLNKDPDRIEIFGFLKDVALDHYRLNSKNVVSFNKERNLLDDEEGPLKAAVGSGLKVSANVSRAAQQLAKDYSYPLPGIMLREAVQNAVDAVRSLGTEGKVSVDIDRLPGGKEIQFTVSDNGKGMDREALQTVFSDLFDSGKADDPNASGGKGVGKATYMLGGNHFTVKSVVEKPNGQKIMYTASGTPQEFMSYVDIVETPVPSNEPTGTQVSTTLDANNEQIDSLHYMGNNLNRFSRNLPMSLEVNNEVRSLYRAQDPVINTENEHHVFEGYFDGNKISISHPKDNLKTDESTFIDINILNNGLYQYRDYVTLSEDVPDLPERVTVNIEPSAQEGHSKYPFPITRESVKENVREFIRDKVIEYIGNPQQQRKRSKVQELYDSMESYQVEGVTRPTVIFDPGKRLEPPQLQEFLESKVAQNLIRAIENNIETILQKTGNAGWMGRLEKVGFILEPTVYGLHVPNPTTGRSTILINPFQQAINRIDPADTAWETVITNLHEVAHIGKEVFSDTDFTVDELDDPKIGDYLRSYFNEVNAHGGADMGHNIAFVKRLGKVFAKSGPRSATYAADQITKIISDDTGGFNPEFERLLHIYKEREGQNPTTEDYLSTTGDKSKNDEFDGTGDIREDSGSDGDGSSIEIQKQFDEIWREINTNNAQKVKDIQKNVPANDAIKVIDEIIQKAQDEIDNAPDEASKESIYRATHDFVRTNLTAFDMSAPFRQGLGLITEPGWWSSWDDMFKSFGSEEAYNLVMDSIREHPSGLFRPRIVPVMRNGKVIIDRKTKLPKVVERKSWAEEAGLVLTDMVGNNEEQFRSKLAERVPITGPIVKASNRAFVGFLNKTRSDVFASLVKQAVADGKDPYTNFDLMKQIAEFVNVASGRGRVRLDVPEVRIPGVKKPLIRHKELDFDASIKALAEVFFAPRLMASRMNTYVNVLNPHFYRTTDPMIRKRTLRSLLGIVGTGLVMGQMINMAGQFFNQDTDIEFDWRNSDFMKARIGNTRFDAFGGYQQYFVGAARFYEGESKSSMSGRTTDLTSGDFGDPTRKDILERLFANKLAPVPGLVWSWMENKNFDGTPFDAKRNLMELTVPLVAQDLYELYLEDPVLMPMSVFPFFGVGIQTYGNR